MILIATHLIDEIAEILEQVIILKDGKVIMAQPIESVKRSVYSITGDSSSVDEYSRNHRVIHEIAIGTLKTATVFGKRDIIDKQVIEEFGLQLNSPRLQDVFIGLTS
jgi:ABC-2 type transport system ATP-binding protein